MVSYRALPSKVEEFFESHPQTIRLFSEAIAERCDVDGNLLVDMHFNPMIEWIYSRIRTEVSAEDLTNEEACFFIRELSVFARYNSQFLRRASRSVAQFCPELGHELMRNHLEEGGERGKLPAHFVIYSGALIKDLGLFVNGYVPQASSTRALIWMHDTIVNSHCPSTILGMYYATEAVATAETEELRRITNQLGRVKGRGSSVDLKNLDFYFRMHLDDNHQAASNGTAVETGHQEGIARFIRQHGLFHFEVPQIIDGFLQMLGPLVDQWTELCANVRDKRQLKMVRAG